MKSVLLTNSLSVSLRVYRALLAAYPKTFRQNYETQMVQVFRDSFRYEVQRNGVSGAIDLWLYMGADLLVTALTERIMERSHIMFSPKVILWCGRASIFAGLCWWVLVCSPYNGPAPIAAMMLALALGLGGVVGLYSGQAGQGGRLGLAGFALGIIGTVVALAALFWIRRESGLAAQTVLILSLALVTLGIGLALLGVANLRAKTLHRWPGLPLGLGLLSAIQGIAIWLLFSLSQGYTYNAADGALLFDGFALLGLGWMGLGFVLAKEADVSVVSPLPDSA